jgi:outer membrane protein TolC
LTVDGNSETLGLMIRPPLVSILLALLVGCASLSPDGGMQSLRNSVEPRLGQSLPTTGEVAASEVKALLAEPLDAEHAVRIALLNNRGLQASYQSLGIADAEWVAMSRPANPLLSFKRLGLADAVSIERIVTFDLLQLIKLPAQQRLGKARFEQTQYEVADRVLSLATEVRKAQIDAVASAQALDYARQVALAADAGADLAHNMAVAGNWSKRDAAQEEAFHATAQVMVKRAEQSALASRELLTRLLGLDRADAFQLPAHLPALPEAPRVLNAAETEALTLRLDVDLRRQQLVAIHEELGLPKIDTLNLGIIRETETGKSPVSGYELGVELPLFSQGQARKAGTEARYRQAAHMLAQSVIDARSQVRERHAAYCSAYEQTALYRDRIIPLRKRIADENMLRYNGMLISTFDLLADGREQIEAVSAASEVLKNFWLADAELQQALGGRYPASASAGDNKP